MSETAVNTKTASTQPALDGLALMVSLTVKDVATSMAWYHEVVGFRIDRKMEHEGKLRSVALVAGNVRVLLNQDNGAKGWERVKGEGFSLTINTLNGVDAAADRIRQNGGTLDSEPADYPWGARMFRITDPDGFKWSISQALTS